MDFVERWLHISPDGGNGLFEVVIVAVILALIVIGVMRRRMTAFVTVRWQRRQRPPAERRDTDDGPETP